MDRVITKPCLYRLAKAGKIQMMGGGRYSTVTQEVKDKKRKVKNSYLSLTQTVTVGVTVTLPLQPDKTLEDLASRPPTEDALRQPGLTLSNDSNGRCRALAWSNFVCPRKRRGRPNCLVLVRNQSPLT
jgi:hypothetical protein